MVNTALVEADVWENSNKGGTFIAAPPVPADGTNTITTITRSTTY